MADCVAGKKLVKKEVTSYIEVEEDFYQLTLSKHEMKTLACILSGVGGLQNTTARKHSDSVFHAITKNVGFTPSCDIDCKFIYSGSIIFNERSLNAIERS